MITLVHEHVHNTWHNSGAIAVCFCGPVFQSPSSLSAPARTSHPLCPPHSYLTPQETTSSCHSCSSSLFRLCSLLVPIWSSGSPEFFDQFFKTGEDKERLWFHIVTLLTHTVFEWAADHRWGTYHNLPGLPPPAVSVCVRLCQYHRRHPACAGTELPSPQVSLLTYCAPFPIGWFLNEHDVFDTLTVWILADRCAFIGEKQTFKTNVLISYHNF